MKEIWKDIPNYENFYQASNYGRIKSVEKMVWNGYQFWKREEKILKLTRDKKGYLNVGLSKNGKFKRCKVHRLIAKTFIPNLNNLPQINHINGIKTDNRVKNLEWCTNQENCIHARKNKLVKTPKGKDSKLSKKIYQFNKDNIFIKEWTGINEVAKQLGVCRRSIQRCCRGERKTAGGYIWRYTNE